MFSTAVDFENDAAVIWLHNYFAVKKLAITAMAAKLHKNIKKRIKKKFFCFNWDWIYNKLLPH